MDPVTRHMNAMNQVRRPETKVARSGLSTLSVLGLIFVTLKLTGHIGWSWWWVTLPLYAPLVLAVVIFMVFVVAVLIRHMVRGTAR